jgi:hypothetical protein
VSTTSLRDACAIVGVANTAYTRGTEQSTLQLHLEASLGARRRGLEPGEVDAVMLHDLGDRCAEEFMVNLGLPDLLVDHAHGRRASGRGAGGPPEAAGSPTWR